MTTAPVLVRAAPLLAALALGGVLVQAGSLPIAGTTLDAAYAERVEVTERLAVVATQLAVFPAETAPRPGSTALAVPCAPATPADGTLGRSVECATEMASAMPRAMMPVALGNWTYTVTLRERHADAIELGTRYRVELRHDGRDVGGVELVQGTDEPLAPEGAQVVFDVGRAPPLSPQFVVLVRALEPAAGEFLLRAVTDVDLSNRWKDAAGTVNPTLQGASGSLLRIQILHEDSGDSPHNLRVKDAAGNVVAGPTEDITSSSRQAVLEWTPTEPGTYRYECKYHAPTQAGAIEIS